jgi:hypothetical protein
LRFAIAKHGHEDDMENLEGIESRETRYQRRIGRDIVRLIDGAGDI